MSRPDNMPGRVASHNTTIIKFIEESAIIAEREKSAHRREVEALVAWCQVKKTFQNLTIKYPIKSVDLN